jgi:hypothetical protein
LPLQQPFLVLKLSARLRSLMSRQPSLPLPAPQKLSHDDVKQIRRRVRRGERITDLAAEYGVDRKTVRRRLDQLT